MVFCETKPKNAHSTWQEKPPHRFGLQHVDRLVALCPSCHAQSDVRRARAPGPHPARRRSFHFGAPPLLQRFWGTVCQCDETVYLILFINDRCLVLAGDRCGRAWAPSLLQRADQVIE
jgi:hypothetical protein